MQGVGHVIGLPKQRAQVLELGWPHFLEKVHIKAMIQEHTRNGLHACGPVAPARRVEPFRLRVLEGVGRMEEVERAHGNAHRQILHE